MGTKTVDDAVGQLNQEKISFNRQCAPYLVTACQVFDKDGPLSWRLVNSCYVRSMSLGDRWTLKATTNFLAHSRLSCSFYRLCYVTSSNAFSRTEDKNFVTAKIMTLNN